MFNTQSFARSRKGFTLVEIMIVVAILGVILAIASPTWFRQRTQSQKLTCQENLHKINGVKEQWAMEFLMDAGDTPAWDDLVSADGTGYLKYQPECPAGGDYSLEPVGSSATCTITVPLDHNLEE